MPPDQILLFFAKYIESELGIVYAEHNYFQLQVRLEEIVKHLGLPNIEALFEKAKVSIDGPMKQLILDVATNNETSFFRDIKVFNGIKDHVLPNFAQNFPGSSSLNIWSAAASTGQEALTLSILISEWNSKSSKPLDYSILSTDISDRALQRAKSATYSQLEVQRGLPAPYLVKYFKKNEKDQWTANDDIRSKIQFKQQNLLKPFVDKGPFQLILCRNVLIYQNVAGKKEIINRMKDLLVPGGAFILGSGESLLGLSNDFVATTVGEAVFYIKKEQLRIAA